MACSAPHQASRAGLAFEGDEERVLVERSEQGEPYEIGRVLVWEPPARLVFSWRQADFPPELTTEVEVGFEAVDDAVTRVSVEHRGFHRVPGDSAARHGFPDAALQMRLAEWWQALMTNLADHCSGHMRHHA
ncbi:MAG: SRPBCC domain-containing protein [Gammaproteobacteria bacterium]|nr:SRPBCC domain-containing protein [Gammaproteobacteria bacterium]